MSPIHTGRRTGRTTAIAEWARKVDGAVICGTVVDSRRIAKEHGCRAYSWEQFEDLRGCGEVRWAPDTTLVMHLVSTLNDVRNERDKAQEELESTKRELTALKAREEQREEFERSTAREAHTRYLEDTYPERYGNGELRRPRNDQTPLEVFIAPTQFYIPIDPGSTDAPGDAQDVRCNDARGENDHAPGASSTCDDAGSNSSGSDCAGSSDSGSSGGCD